MLIETALEPPVFGLSQPDRESRLEPVLRELTNHHLDRSVEYRRIVQAMFPRWREGSGISSIPYLPVGIFKQRVLKSVPDNEVFKTVSSSGTTGSASQVFVDRNTASRQTRSLMAIMADVLGAERRPMIIVDTDAIIRDRSNRTARAAGVIGMMSLGRKHKFLLDSDMNPQADRIEEFAEQYSGKPILIFGFTFMIWEYLYKAFGQAGIDLSGATVVHSGGWKKMESESVDNETFKAALKSAFGIERVVNFYGMAEQVGSVFVEGDDGLLHSSCFADVIVRDPHTWAEQPTGEPGLLQVLSAVPTSYPGHSILTEDLGVVVSVDGEGDSLRGKAFRVLGRLPKSELRGCSDTFTEPARD